MPLRFDANVTRKWLSYQPIGYDTLYPMWGYWLALDSVDLVAAPVFVAEPVTLLVFSMQTMHGMLLMPLKAFTSRRRTDEAKAEVYYALARLARPSSLERLQTREVLSKAPFSAHFKHHCQRLF